MASEVAPQPSTNGPGDRDKRIEERTERTECTERSTPTARWEPEVGSNWQLEKFHADVCRSALGIITAKNEDYSGQADIFSNLHVGGAYGILVRIGDKFSRIFNFER